MQKDIVDSKRTLWVLLAMVALSTGTLQAHPFHTDFGGLADGWIHPWLGLDHILAMIAVGFWAAQLGGRARWLVPGSFLALMSAGAVLGMGSAPAPLVEQAIAASVFGLGLLIALSIRLPLAAGMLLAGLFAFFHGLAHGGESAAQASAPLYLAGFILATVMLHLIGIALGVVARRPANLPWVRCVGVSILAAGLLLFLK